MLGAWAITGQRCSSGFPTPEDAPAAPVVTPELVQTEFQRLPLAKSTTHIQPRGRTLVQLPTIFYTDADVQTFDVTIVGLPVHIEATPTTYDWDFGDGNSLRTRKAGRPYPDKDITHVYVKTGVTVTPSVRVTFTGRYQVSGGAWEAVPQPVIVQGPPTDLRIMQARAHLVAGNN